MKKFIWLIAAVVILGLILWFAPFRGYSPPPSGDLPATDTYLPLTEIDSASERIFSLNFKDYSGNTVSLSDFQGQPLVLNTWASWCPFCRREMPDLAAAQEKFGDQVRIIAINRAESLETAKRYSDDLGVSGRMMLVLDPGDAFYTAIGGFSMPETVFMNAKGEIVEHVRGVLDQRQIEERIQKIL